MQAQRSLRLPHARPRSYRLLVRAASRTDTLRRLLKEPAILKGPCCHDALSARLIEKAGFSVAFMSGFCTAGAKLGAPDTGLISYAEMVDQGRYIMEATKHIPVIGDGDTGYGNAMNVKRTVKGYARAGFAGILIEDQVAPKSCGHVRGKRVVSREEAVSRIRAAADARDEGADILIVARTDARQAASFEEALWRVGAFAEAGADILFVDALESEEEMRVLCQLGGAAAHLPKMANMLEGGGKTPVLSPEQLQSMGFKLVAYPLSLLGVSIRAMETALEGLKEGRVPGSDQLGSFEDIQAAVGFPEYYAEEARYAISTPWSDLPPAAAQFAAHGMPPPPGSPPPPEVVAAEAEAAAAEAAEEAAAAARTSSSSSSGGGTAGSTAATVEADAVIEGTGSSVVRVSQPGKEEGKEDYGGDTSKDRSDRRSQYFRVRISDAATDLVKLETRIPAGFLPGLAALVPSVQGFNLQVLVDRALYSKERDPGVPLVNSIQGGDRIQIFLE